MIKKHRKNADLYFIAVVPPENIASEITKIKEDFAKNYRSKQALKSPPHITLHMPFWWKNEREQELLNFVQTFSSGKESFDLILKNFNHFDKRVIFVDVENNFYLIKLYNDLTSAIKKSLGITNQAYKDRAFNPHMTVAFKDLRPGEFNNAWPNYAEKKLQYEFRVDHTVLLKHNGQRWLPHGHFSF